MAERLLAPGERGQHQCDTCLKLFDHIGNGEWIPTTCPNCMQKSAIVETTAITQLSHDIAKHLTDAWTAEAGQHDRATLSHANGWQISLEISWRDNGRVEITGLFHQEIWYHTAGQQLPKITVAILRGPTTIAKEIERRLLPKYIELYERIEAAEKRRQTELNAELDAMTLIAEVTHGEIPARSNRPRSGGLIVRFGHYQNFNWPYGEATSFYNDRLDLKLIDLKADEAAAVLKTLIALRSEAK